MTISTSLDVTSIYAALLGIMFIVFTLRVGAYRAKNRISLGDGGNNELQRRSRAQGNFIESVPIALILLALVELSGASATWLHALRSMLVIGRWSHWLQLSGFLKPLAFRPIGMVLTLMSILVSSILLLLQAV